ncbi:hypothetical protein BX616_005709 [Lobosporangium transversale]|uniref:Uncharacterized protein n=1 Tax=Lobosporangium transversale TaxID=64571 RepID=A0A1Y2GX99_9FUNG|nr:hypothetical protein BCR41DRAFT_25050 [Lobosporangium transversale]KAF9897376.1 hypothetical protein BX616_005709 [Lobosporangium transversale]ORZ21967.1 hypothetical protein BCR41DRAFT_25050 [Lobosporangium transversale]|eukprot:XP_021883218.1 hypothetical protein BCR41DRAFT_25050 [Lobosporangium transversale]
MYARPFITIVLLALCTLGTVLASPPPKPSRDIFSVTSPEYESVYRVGQYVPVAISIVNGTEGYLYQKNPSMRITIQKNIRYPNLNERVGEISARELYHSGFRFKVKKAYLIETQKTVPFRVRVSFSAEPRGGFNDSPSFRLKPKKD